MPIYGSLRESFSWGYQACLELGFVQMHIDYATRIVILNLEQPRRAI